MALVGGAGYWFVLKPGGSAEPKPGAIMSLESTQINLASGHYLKIGLALVLVWVGIKMLLKIDIYYIPTPLSLGVIATILGVSIGASLWATRGQERKAPAGPAHAPFGTATAEEMAELEPLWRRGGAGATATASGGEAGEPGAAASDVDPHASAEGERK